MRLPAYQDLSKEQDKINSLPLDGSHLVIGPPGTGKTVMALYRARMLSERGTKVSLLMLSRLLSQYTSDAATELEVDNATETFHRWLFGFYLATYRRRYPQLRPYKPDWAAILEQVNKEPPAKATLAHLIVDEAQDFAAGFFLVARHLARSLTVFADENQRLQTDNSSIAAIQAYTAISKAHKLTRNYRNTQEIATLAKHFYTGLQTGIPELPQRSGDMPVMSHHRTCKASIEFILRFEKNHRDLDIGVLVPNKKVQKTYFEGLRAQAVGEVQRFEGGKGSKAEVLNFGQPGIKVICYQSAKGLEFDAVFLPELQEYGTDISLPEFKMLYYVLISRARDYLFLSYSGEGRPRILDAFPNDLLEWR